MLQASANPSNNRNESSASSYDWSAIGEAEHFVQFYEADAFLLNSLSGFVGEALQAGDAVIVIAMKEHREGLSDRLRQAGFNLAAATAARQYVVLDAAETLSQFMVQGAPDPARFISLIGGIIEKSHGRRRIRAFGEMVALLWAEGQYQAAIRLEELWNELQQRYTFSLFCAYQMKDFGRTELGEKLDHVCSTHSRVIPAESYTAKNNLEDRLRTVIDLQQKAAALEAEVAVRKEAELRLQKALAQAEEAIHLKDEFLATVSHELRTPLNAIIGWATVLRSGKLDQIAAARAVETIVRNGRTQAQIIDDLLDVSKIIAGKLRLQVRAINLIPIIEAAVEAVSPAAEAKGVRVRMLLDFHTSPVLGDPDRLQQVIWNLLTNAVKFTHTGGQVQVELVQTGHSVRISVTDNGIGIRPEFLPQVFGRFTQADGSITRQHGGLGLGLAVVKHLVELHGGAVDAESRGEGQGATFSLTLPLAQQPNRLLSD